MTRAILLLDVPSLLASQGPGHQPPCVHFTDDCGWIEGTADFVDMGCPEALPLFWRDAPCYPAIDALVRAAEAADTRWAIQKGTSRGGRWAQAGPCWTVYFDNRRQGTSYTGRQGIEGAQDAERRFRAEHWDFRRRAATDYAGVLALANEAATILGGKIETV